MQDGYKVYMHSYMASNGSCVHGHLDDFQKPVFERSRPNKYQKTMALQNLTTIELLYFIMCEDLVERREEMLT